jgi:hypothetical protein
MASRVEDHTASVVIRGLTLTAPARCVVITCDHAGCGAEHAHAGTDEERATESAAGLGWTWDGGERDGCPLHPVEVDGA